MTASRYIKSQGLPSVAYVADKVGKHRDTINNWYHNNYALFEVVVAGVAAKNWPVVFGTSYYQDMKDIINKEEYNVGGAVPDELLQDYMEDFVKAFSQRDGLIVKTAMQYYLNPLIRGIHKRGENSVLIKQGKE